jgi:hypothetical protein
VIAGEQNVFLPSLGTFGVLDAAPSPNNSAGLEGNGVCTRLAGLRVVIGADIDGRRELDKLSGRPSSESRSPDVPERSKRQTTPHMKCCAWPHIEKKQLTL